MRSQTIPNHNTDEDDDDYNDNNDQLSVVQVEVVVTRGKLPAAEMGEIDGSYRVLQTPGTRLGAQFNAGISTLEPGQSLGGGVIVSGGRNYGRLMQIRVQGLDESLEFFDIDVSVSFTPQRSVCRLLHSRFMCDLCSRAHIQHSNTPSRLPARPPAGGLRVRSVCDSCLVALVLKSLLPH